MRAVSGCTEGVTLHLAKRLPMGGGVGGGSSDAACAVVGLNKLWKLNLPETRLLHVGQANELLSTA